MGLVCYTLHWTPDQFWRSTPHEVMAVIDYCEEQAPDGGT